MSRINPRMTVVSALDPELVKFLEGLDGRIARKKGGGLEEALLTLLTFLGFSCLHTGLDERQPDVLAWAIDPSLVYIIECTTAEPDLRNKVTKLKARLRQFQLHAPLIRTIGILVTTLPDESINPADIERLRTDEIILIDKESLKRLLKFAEQGVHVGDVLEFLENLGIEQQTGHPGFLTS